MSLKIFQAFMSTIPMLKILNSSHESIYNSSLIHLQSLNPPLTHPLLSHSLIHHSATHSAPSHSSSHPLPSSEVPNNWL